MSIRDARHEVGPPSRRREAGAMARPAGQRSARNTYKRLRMVGLTATEAGNLTAHLSGLQVTEQSWTLNEIERLEFLRILVDLGCLPS
jgi:hypothetical protein